MTPASLGRWQILLLGAVSPFTTAPDCEKNPCTGILASFHHKVTSLHSRIMDYFGCLICRDVEVLLINL